MNLYRLALYVIVFSVIFTGCYEEPDFPDEPRLVSFDGDNGLIFKENPEGWDTLQIRVLFEDGDGDLGLSGSGIDQEYPYNEINFETDAAGNPIKFDSNKDVFECSEYYIVKASDSLRTVNGKPLTIADTLKVEYNKFGRNLDIHLLVKNQDGYEEFDFQSVQAGCAQPLGGRFPRLKEDFSDESPRKGVIQYKAISPVLLSLFRNDSLKIQVQIRDRALHESNIIESKPFTLTGIQR